MKRLLEHLRVLEIVSFVNSIVQLIGDCNTYTKDFYFKLAFALDFIPE